MKASEWPLLNSDIRAEGEPRKLVMPPQGLKTNKVTTVTLLGTRVQSRFFIISPFFNEARVKVQSGRRFF